MLRRWWLAIRKAGLYRATSASAVDVSRLDRDHAGAPSRLQVDGGRRGENDLGLGGFEQIPDPHESLEVRRAKFPQLCLAERHHLAVTNREEVDLLTPLAARVGPHGCPDHADRTQPPAGLGEVSPGHSLPARAEHLGWPGRLPHPAPHLSCSTGLQPGPV